MNRQFATSASDASTSGAQRAALAVGREEPGEDRDDRGQRGQRGGQQPTQAPGPERSETDGAGACVLVEQQRRDQEPRQREERRDPQVATDEEAEPAVVREHARDGEATKSVERRLVRHTGSPGPAPGGELAPGSQLLGVQRRTAM